MRTFTTIRNLILCVSACALLLTIGCPGKDRSDVSKSEEEISPVVASVGDGDITAADLKGYLSQRPIPPRLRGSEEEIKKRLDEMVLEEVLYQEALRLKLDQDPKMRKSIRQMLTQKLMSRHMYEKTEKREIGEKDLQEYYDKHHDEFNRPAQVRLADIFISVPSDATEEKKAELKKKAETALNEAVALRGKRSGFGTLVRKYSDTHEKYRQGDTGFIDIDGKPVGIDKQLAEAAFKLERVGSMPEQVIETPDGYHVIMLTGKRSAINWPLEKVRNQITQRIRRETLKKEREDFIEGLKAGADISIDDKVVAQVVSEMAPPKKQPPAIPKNTKAETEMPQSPPRPPALPGQK